MTTGADLEPSWETVRRDIDDVLAVCTRMSSADAGDDMRSLLRELEQSVDKLAHRPAVAAAADA